MPRVSVIVPTFNRGALLEQSLSALARQTIAAASYEVVVVDDGSTDGSLDAIRTMDLPYALRVVAQSNQGAGAARNRGAMEARANCLVFLDADMVPAPDLLEQYGRADAQHPRALLMGRQNPWPPAYESQFDRITRFEWLQDLGPAPVVLRYYNVMSGNMAIRREHFELLGGFSESIGVGVQPAADDMDFGYRALRAGHPLVYWPTALAYHNHPRTFEQRCAQVQTGAEWVARLFQDHPELVGTIPVFVDAQPISWREDGLAMISRKMARRLQATEAAQGVMKKALRWGEQFWPQPRLLSTLYWRVLSGCRFRGFRAGLKREVAYSSCADSTRR